VLPLVWWHASLPRAFAWFREGDFVALPAALAPASVALHVAVLLAWVGRQAWLLAHGRPVNLAKAFVLATTWLAWFGAIVLLDSDLAFTSANVLAHAVPYLALVRRWGRARHEGGRDVVARLFAPRALALWAGALAAVAYLEEGLWDRLYGHAHDALFPLPAVSLDAAAASVVAGALAVPQATHYVLDAFLWRTGAENPGLAEALAMPAGGGGAPASRAGPTVSARVPSAASRA
jgi:hypothetical protein